MTRSTRIEFEVIPILEITYLPADEHPVTASLYENGDGSLNLRCSRATLTDMEKLKNMLSVAEMAMGSLCCVRSWANDNARSEIVNGDPPF